MRIFLPVAGSVCGVVGGSEDVGHDRFPLSKAAGQRRGAFEFPTDADAAKGFTLDADGLGPFQNAGHLHLVPRAAAAGDVTLRGQFVGDSLQRFSRFAQLLHDRE